MRQCVCTCVPLCVPVYISVGTCVSVLVCVHVCSCVHLCALCVSVHPCASVYLCTCVHLCPVFMCLPVCACVHLCVCMCASMCICVSVYVCVPVYICVVYLCVYVCVHLCICAPVYICVCLCPRVHIYTPLSGCGQKIKAYQKYTKCLFPSVPLGSPSPTPAETGQPASCPIEGDRVVPRCLQQAVKGAGIRGSWGAGLSPHSTCAGLSSPLLAAFPTGPGKWELSQQRVGENLRQKVFLSL